MQKIPPSFFRRSEMAIYHNKDIVETMNEFDTSVWPGRPIPTRFNRNQTFTGFESLPMDVCYKIVEQLDAPTSISLMCCSKSTNALVKKVRLVIDNIYVTDEMFHGPFSWDLRNEKEKHICVTLLPKRKSDSVMIVYFVKSGKDTTVVKISIRSPYEKSIPYRRVSEMVLKNCNYFEHSVSFVENLLASSTYKVEEFQVCVKEWGNNANFFSKLKVTKKLCACTYSTEYLNRWLETTDSTEPLKYLMLVTKGNSKQILNHKTVKNAEKLQYSAAKCFNTHAFLSLKADEITIWSKTDTVNTFNRFLKKWRAGIREPKCSSLTLCAPDYVRFENVLAGVPYFEWRLYAEQNAQLDRSIQRDYNPHRCFYIEPTDNSDGAIVVLKYSEMIFIRKGKLIPNEPQARIRQARNGQARI